MKKRSNRSQKTTAPKELQLCMKVAAVLCTEYSLIGHNLCYDRKEISAFTQGLARLGQIARDEEHLAELLDALHYEMGQELVPFSKWGTDLLKRVLKGGLPDVD